jgi:hypothetical protein
MASMSAAVSGTNLYIGQKIARSEMARYMLLTWE